MSKDNFDDAMHIIKKINFFLGMSVQDFDHLNYGEEERKLLVMLLNLNGKILLDHMVEAVCLVNKISTIKGTKTGPKKVNLDDVQKEWEKVFLNVKQNSTQRNILSEGQESKEDAQESTGDPRDPEMEEGRLGEGDKLGPPE